MAQKVKVPFLETSPEKFQPKDGSGSYRSGCPTPTGNRLPAILQAPPASSSPTDDPLKSQSEGSSNPDWEREELMADWYENSGNFPQPASGECGATDSDLLLFWNQRIPVRMKG